jgi:hypothetical protein
MGSSGYREDFMQPTRVFRELAKQAGGRMPSPVEQAWIGRSEWWPGALKGSPEALSELARYYAWTCGLDTGGKGRASRSVHAKVRSIKSLDSAARAAELAGRLAREAEQVDGPVRMLRRQFGYVTPDECEGRVYDFPVARPIFDLRRAGSDNYGLWQEVRVGYPSWTRIAPETMKLRRLPVALQVRDDEQVERPESRVGPMQEVLKWARVFGLRYGWSEFDTVRWLATDKVPQPAPVAVRILTTRDERGRAVDGTKTITIMARQDTPARLVAAAFARAAGHGKVGRRESARTRSVVAHVKRLVMKNGGRHPTWAAITRDYNEAHPGQKLDRWNLCKIYKRATARQHGRAGSRPRLQPR